MWALLANACAGEPAPELGSQQAGLRKGDDFELAEPVTKPPKKPKPTPPPPPPPPPPVVVVTPPPVLVLDPGNVATGPGAVLDPGNTGLIVRPPHADWVAGDEFEVLDPGTPMPPPVPGWDDALGSRTTDSKVVGERWVKKTVVGVAPPGFTCPTPEDGSRWKGGLMFENKVLADQPLEERGGLFCRYEYDGPLSGFDWSGLPQQAVPCGGNNICLSRIEGPRWLHPDARVASAQAPEDALVDIRDRLVTQYLAQMDQPVVGAATPGGRKVDLAILDSVGDSAASQSYPLPGAGHGRALAMAAYRVACPDGVGSTCPINIRQYRAFVPGTIASLSDLATVIVKAVDASALLGNSLVINISLGLHPRFAWWDLPGENPEYPDGVLLPAFRAVKSALNYATARGAIVIAAAGNTDGSHANPVDRSDELLYPAAFDGQQGWTCDAARVCTSVVRPLIHAAGGVTAENEDLPNARFSSHPVPFVAPGCNVALDNQLPWEDPQNPLPLYCGTSFGAIGVSAVIAAAWAHMPGAIPPDVLAAVRAGGTDRTSGQACTGANCRVRLCNTLHELGADVTCGALSVASVSESSIAQFVNAYGVATSWQGEADNSVIDAACDSDVVYSDPQVRNTAACPAAEYESALPDSETLLDQPGNPGCGSCSVAYLRVNGQDKPYLVGAFADDVRGNILSPSLEHDGRAYELGASLAPALANGGLFAVPLISGTTSSGTSSVAKLSYLKRDAASQQSVVQVDPMPVVR